MSRSVFAVDRAVFDHPMFASEPFTEREAWLWLLAEAAWKPRRIRVRNGIMDLDRGQLAHSTRFMASKWQWSEARVRRFLSRLESDAMIDALPDAHATRITICNYDEYQKVSLPRDALGDADDDAHATRTRRKEESNKSREEDIKPDGLISRGRETPAGALAGVLDAEHAKAVVDHRQRIRKPLTPHAAKLLAGKFAQCPDPNAAADTMIANGWQGFEPSWLASRSTGPPAQRSVNGFAAVALALAEQDHDPGTHADFDPPGGGTAPRPGTERGNPQPRVLDTERPERAGGAYTVVDR